MERLTSIKALGRFVCFLAHLRFVCLFYSFTRFAQLSLLIFSHIVDGVVEIILAKGVNSEIWWPVVQLGHPEIDVKAIDGAKYLDDSILKKIYEQVCRDE
jgi:hypothetical protein